MKKILFIIGVIVIIGLGFFTVSGRLQDTTSNSGKLNIVTTLFPSYDFAKIIGQDKVEVSLLLPPGVESHSFEPRPSDIVKINKSDLFVYTGKYMEPWAEDIIKGLTNKDVSIVDSSNGITLSKREENHDDEEEGVHEEELENDHGHEGIDPHIWLGLDNAQVMVDNIVNAISQKDPANSDFYMKNAIEYKNRLVQLDNQFKSTLAKCEGREIIYGGHYAFGYMAKRYGLAYTSAQGFSPDSEPTASDLVNLVEQIKAGGIKYVFYEELTSPKIAQTLANETKAQLLLLNAAHNIAKEDYKKGVSFASIMEQNLANLKIGLNCKN